MGPIVPEHWDAPAVATPPPRPYGWLSLPLGVVATLLTPRRAGPRLAVTGWGKIVTVSLLAAMTFLLLTIVSLFATDSRTAERYVPPGTPWTLRPRLAAVAAVEWLAWGDGFSQVHVVALWVLGVVAPLAWLGVAWLIMPLVLGARTRRAAAGRALKIAMWSALFGPIAWAAVSLVSWDKWGLRCWLENNLDRGVPQALAVLLTAVAWTGWVWRLCSRDVGGPGAPAMTPQVPRCRDCAYVLTGLPLDACCPECGLAVERSTPAARRPTPWAAGPPDERRVAAYLATVWGVLRHPRAFFARLPVLTGREAALSFAAWTSWVVGSCVLAVTLLVGLAAHVTNTFIGRDLGAALVAAVGLGVLGTRATVAGLAWLSSRGGWNASPATIIVTCYAGAWMIPITLITGLIAILNSPFAGRGMWELTIEHMSARDVWLITESLLRAVPVLACVTWALVCYRRGLRLTRHAVC